MTNKAVGLVALFGTSAIALGTLVGAAVKGPENIRNYIAANCDEHCGPKSTFISIKRENATLGPATNNDEIGKLIQTLDKGPKM